MGKFATNFDLPSLNLLLREINATLKDAEHHINEFAEDESQAILLTDSSEVLAQLANVFDLITLKGTGHLTRALAQNFAQLGQSADNTKTDLIMDISEGVLILGRYVEFILLQETLEPALILPIVNKLRAHLGQEALMPANLREQNSISISDPKTKYQPLDALDIDKAPLLIAYRAGLLTLLSAQNDTAKIQGMTDAILTIAKHSQTLFWQAAAYATTQAVAHLPLSDGTKRTLIYLEQQFNDYLPLSDRRFANLVSLAMQNADFEQLAAQKYAYAADQNKLDGMYRALVGPDRDITQTLNTLIQEEITAIKDKVDEVARGNSVSLVQVDPSDIAHSLSSLAKVMQVLNLNQAHTALDAAAKDVSAWQTPSNDDLDALLGQLLVAENASIYLVKSHTPGAISLPLHNKDISLHQLDTAYTTLIKEGRTNIAIAESAITAYMQNQDAGALINLPEMLRQIAGATSFLNLEHIAKMMMRCSRFVDDTLQKDSEQVDLDERQLALLADVITTADHYLEGLENHSPAGDRVMRVGQHSLNALLA